MHIMNVIYFDNAASTKVREDAIEVMLSVMRDEYGNPSSSHFLGRMASARLSAARENVAAALGAAPDEVYFTSGGTESDNWAVLGAAELMSRKGRHIITSHIEHEAVLQTVKKLEHSGWDVTYLSPDNSGRISEDSFAAALREDTVLASVMLVNNETGALNPVGLYAREIRRRKLDTILHTDAVQGFCKIPFSVRTLGADLVTVSAHKIHGPKGAGALFMRAGTKLPPLLLGGGHENGKRSGTEALPAIAGFGEAARLGRAEMQENSANARTIREYIAGRICGELPGAFQIGDGDSPFLLNISLPGYKSEVLMNYLEGEGICVSKGSACKKGARSRVLVAMSLKDDVIDGALRLSFGRYNTIGEAERFCEVLKKASETLLKTL